MKHIQVQAATVILVAITAPSAAASFNEPVASPSAAAAIERELAEYERLDFLPFGEVSLLFPACFILDGLERNEACRCLHVMVNVAWSLILFIVVESLSSPSFEAASVSSFALLSDINRR
jgi:hypothetical protein